MDVVEDGDDRFCDCDKAVAVGLNFTSNLFRSTNKSIIETILYPNSIRIIGKRVCVCVPQEIIYCVSSSSLCFVAFPISWFIIFVATLSK